MDTGREQASPSSLRTRSERQVWSYLTAQLEPGEALLPNVRLTDIRHGDVEADILVFVPNAGIAVVEVKGGTVVYEHGEWVVKQRRWKRRVQPVEQGRRAKHALRRYLDRQPDWGLGLIRCTWFAAFPDTLVAGDLGPEGRRAQIIDTLDLPRALDLIRRELRNPLNNDPVPDKDAIDTALSLILRINPNLEVERRTPWRSRVVTGLVGLVLVSGCVGAGRAVGMEWGWRWGLAAALVVAPATAASTWLIQRRRQHKGRTMLVAAATTTLALVAGVGWSVNQEQPWMFQTTCAVGYSPCLPVVEDLDCGEIAAVVTVSGEDVYGLDRNGDGLGCESFTEPPNTASSR